MHPSRRQVLSLPVSALGAAQSGGGQPLKVVCIGGHPDDPESGCAGTLARYIALGCTATIIYLTRGEAGIRGKSHEEAAAIRTAEAQTACQILGAKPVFAGQIDGATVVDHSAVESLGKLLAAEQPGVVFTQWPIDTHLDHQAASILTTQIWARARPHFELYFYEVNLGEQTMGFHPTDYVDITSVREKKKAALFAHKSQQGERIYSAYHQVMENYRGRESGCNAAEAFVHLARVSSAQPLPGMRA